MVAFPCGWVGMYPCGLYPKIKGPAQWNWSGKSVLPFPSLFVQSWESSVWGSLWESAELWKSFPGMWCLCAGAVVTCWRGTGRENAGRASCCRQDNTEEESLVEPFWAAFAVVEPLGFPLCSSRQKVERLVVQYLSPGSDSPLINLLLMLLRFCQGFFFLQASQSRSERRLFSVFKSCSNLRMEIFLWAAVVSENNTKFGSREFSAQFQ